MKSNLKLTIGAVLGMVAAGALSAEAFAATLYVDKDLGDDEAGLNCEVAPCETIGNALFESSPGDTIEVSPGTYEEYDLDIPHEITIKAADPSNPPTIDAEGDGRHFTIDIPEASWIDPTSNLVKIRNVSLVNGDAGSERGGSIKVTSGRLKLVNATLSGNSASNGGAIDCYWENCQELIVKESVLENNTAVAGGGAITTYGPATIRSSAFLNNSSGGSGGAISIYVWVFAQHRLDVSDSEFEGNEAEGDGGAIYSWSSPVTIERSAFISNEADGGGSAIYFAANQSSEKELVMTNSTFYSNHAVGWWANLAFVDNTAIEDGRHVYSADSRIEVLNSYFYTAPELADLGLTDPCVSTGPTYLIAGENNLWGGAVMGDCYTYNQISAGELTPDSLSPLGYHGGPTRSFLLENDSNALNEGANECPHPITGVPLEDDQRGVARPRGLVCDIGPTEQGGFVIDPSDIPSDFPVGL